MRAFPESDKLIMFERQNHKCAICGKEKEYSEMHGDHIIPWSKGGRTTLDNGQMLCVDCNLRKSAQ
jgi:5-methylcytosine-specific restriction endonuclease McrA